MESYLGLDSTLHIRCYRNWNLHTQNWNISLLVKFDIDTKHRHIKQETPFSSFFQKHHVHLSCEISRIHRFVLASFKNPHPFRRCTCFIVDATNWNEEKAVALLGHSPWKGAIMGNSNSFLCSKLKEISDWIDVFKWWIPQTGRISMDFLFG